MGQRIPAHTISSFKSRSFRQDVHAIVLLLVFLYLRLQREELDWNTIPLVPIEDKGACSAMEALEGKDVRQYNLNCRTPLREPGGHRTAGSNGFHVKMTCQLKWPAALPSHMCLHDSILPEQSGDGPFPSLQAHLRGQTIYNDLSLTRSAPNFDWSTVGRENREVGQIDGWIQKSEHSWKG